MAIKKSYSLIFVCIVCLLISRPTNSQTMHSLIIDGDDTLPGVISGAYTTTSDLSWIEHIFPGNANGFMWSIMGGSNGGILFGQAQEIPGMASVRPMFNQPTTFFSVGAGVSINEAKTINMANLRMKHAGEIIDVGSGSGYVTLVPLVNDITALNEGENGWMINPDGSYHLIYNTRGTCVDCTLKIHLTGMSHNTPALSDRGNGMVYDEVLDITWIIDAGMARRDIGENVNWGSASQWANNLVYGGYSDWRLPSMDVNNDGVILNCLPPTTELECRDNEYAYLFNRHGVRLIAPDSFINIGTLHYWSGTENPVFPGLAYLFNLDTGFQGTTSKITVNRNAIVVRDGDILNSTLRCDLNSNESIDAGDILRVSKMATGQIPANLDCDLNNDGLGDGIISLVDLLIISKIMLGITQPLYK